MSPRPPLGPALPSDLVHFVNIYPDLIKIKSVDKWTSTLPNNSVILVSFLYARVKPFKHSVLFMGHRGLYRRFRDTGFVILLPGIYRILSILFSGI